MKPHDKAMRTRRAVLKIAGAAAALFGLSVTRAQAKSSQGSVAYRNTPNGRQRCADCVYFEVPNACSAVRGPVSARGWCNIWSG
jgi:hypothetical protein